MITLTTERGLVRIGTWSDIETLPGFDKNIDPKTVKLQSILGKYRFADHVTCGLSTCHHKHFRGYVVVAEGGRVTNIGKDCGKTHFGVDFETLSREFDRDLLDRERREALHAARNRVDSYARQIDELKNAPKGGTWLNKQLKALREIGTGLPPNLCRVLDNLIRAQSNTLVRQRLASERELEIMRETGAIAEDDKRSKVMIDEEVGLLAGLPVLYAENDIRQLLVLNLGETMGRLRKIDIDSASSHELAILTKRVSNIEPTMERCQQIIVIGQQFFARENLAQLAEITESADDEKRAMDFARRY